MLQFFNKAHKTYYYIPGKNTNSVRLAPWNTIFHFGFFVHCDLDNFFHNIITHKIQEVFIFDVKGKKVFYPKIRCTYKNNEKLKFSKIISKIWFGICKHFTRENMVFVLKLFRWPSLEFFSILQNFLKLFLANDTDASTGVMVMMNLDRRTILEVGDLKFNFKINMGLWIGLPNGLVTRAILTQISIGQGNS